MAVIEAALEAARRLAGAHGLPATGAVVLHAGSNVVVHLAPAGPAQPVHGDASLSNLLATTDGRRLWVDFEDVRRGPVEADVAGLVDAARNRGLGNRYETALLSAYGPVDAEVFRAHLRLHALYGAAWRAQPPR